MLARNKTGLSISRVIFRRVVVLCPFLLSLSFTTVCVIAPVIIPMRPFVSFISKQYSLLCALPCVERCVRRRRKYKRAVPTALVALYTRAAKNPSGTLRKNKKEQFTTHFLGWGFTSPFLQSPGSRSSYSGTTCHARLFRPRTDGATCVTCGRSAECRLRRTPL